jgi:hypothetical protein
MRCSGCGKRVSLQGDVCPYCQRDKGQDQARHNLRVGSFLVGGLLAVVIGGISGSAPVGMLVFCAVLVAAAVLIDQRPVDS